jgi:hypothetical protein
MPFAASPRLEALVAVETVRFDFLGVFRPAVILGNSNTPSVLAHVMPLLHWAMPSKYHSIHKNDLARDGGAVGASVPSDRAGLPRTE